ncbi:gluconate 2-dehydrogenase subunit 3 family protein [Dyadobacter pollutisoli]|jgi:hypothetical protein|uniref:Gluconate 2-dehydrogenase subunit 3 family protein n=1 Tax=Dyadobacter pollutisoli TaxID=2910158 RepID=A0A9E8SMN4_9BACT|nr:gluconate 2-dehydrogenase subunit 3 family protein [Dyadobacter pollutisoli]WAC14940.1 gluconate 2-dehydrogenase subunit 3 family protein [Dyadobacter pollutisoli]
MDRRSALIQMGVTAGGILAFTACRNNDKKTISSAYAKLGISEKEVGFLGDLAEVIIPSDPEVKGSDALDLKAFVLLMVNDCMKKQDQEIYMIGLRAFQKSVENQDLKDKAMETAFIKGLSGNDENPEEKSVKVFLLTTKQYTIQGFLTSKYFMTEIMPYEMMPGKFDGKFRITPGHKVNIYG